ncbi:glycine/D-amino acid oxidase-like deaminating enzyme [Pelomonas aquatica]|uniref:Glycine/D-amino acid oxidase-like deaminating enzyme n=1 Tax=Pelomonas aquatica TaxID=431058 RepID=A0ABU1Z3F4_9BURK|nr:GMC oxidoreductase [Pelomonas aquatica]MDR7295147.1 glycine/D-amino acid oxidase-like deaminating enzyme [Pelomonas aquatica]
MKPKAVIVGAGLGGCMLAHGLLDSHDVVIIERGAAAVDGRYPVVDVGLPAVTDPHFGSGLGGSTQLWHNGLIEIDEEIFAAHWPFPKSALDPYYDQAFALLSGTSLTRVREAIGKLRQRYRDIGLPDGLLQGLYYPQWPRNVWEALQLQGRVEVVRADVVDFQLDESDGIASLTVADGELRRQIPGEVFVLAAGGLSSPVLLQKLAARRQLPALRHAGAHYEDHPMGFVGEVEVTVPLYRLWNYRVPGTDGNLRLPLVVKRAGLHMSFQLRPAANYYRNSRRERVGSVLNDLRRNPWNPWRYLQLFKHWDDVLDILSFKFGIRLPTRHYTLLLCAQMPTAPELSIWGEQDSANGSERRLRRWHLSDDFRRDLDASVQDVLAWLAPVTRRARVFAEWQNGLSSAAHHSGTARLSTDAGAGVCDADARVHGLRNLFVCDGSLIPSSGIANTGLTIAALALRLAAHLRRRPYRTPEESRP